MNIFFTFLLPSLWVGDEGSQYSPQSTLVLFGRSNNYCILTTTNVAQRNRRSFVRRRRRSRTDLQVYVALTKTEVGIHISCIQRCFGYSDVNNKSVSGAYIFGRDVDYPTNKELFVEITWILSYVGTIINVRQVSAACITYTLTDDLQDFYTRAVTSHGQF